MGTSQGHLGASMCADGRKIGAAGALEHAVEQGSVVLAANGGESLSGRGRWRRMQERTARQMREETRTPDDEGRTRGAGWMPAQADGRPDGGAFRRRAGRRG